MKKYLGSVFAFVLLITLTASAQAVQYKIIDLGTLGGIDSHAYGINNNGQVVGKAEMASGQTHAFLWQNGEKTDLGTLEGTNGSFANGINDNGQIVGGTIKPDGDYYHAFLWKNSTMTDIGVLNGYQTSYAKAINNSGQIIGESDPAGSVTTGHACLWQNGNIISLGTTGEYGSHSYDINNIGQVVCTSGRAFLWENNTRSYLPLPDGTNSSFALSINDHKQVAGSYYLPGGLTAHACLWQNGTMLDIGTLDGSSSVACGINNNGQIIGWSSTSNGEVHVFLWQDSSPMYELSTLGGRYSNAYGINDNGWIVGDSQWADGRTHAVLWQPIVPEPSSILTLLCGIGTLGGLALRRRRA